MTRPRGPYRKSAERRAEILDAALAEYAAADAGGPTLKAVATRLDLAESALLYHFGSREELFWEIVRARDKADQFRPDGQPLEEEDFLRLGEMISHNASTPGLVRLFLEQAIAAVSESHPGHDYMRDRYERFAEVLARGLQHAKGLAPERAQWLARVLVAAADGLQIQWLFNPDLDMRGDLGALVDLALAVEPGAEGSDGTTSAESSRPAAGRGYGSGHA
ncbi:MAG: TetR/AcrR family transcriptional regulator [Propionibacteriaceae bacterium]|jgi:AcrR family transcriptional regulator|nr:TetR/AcrR family transcriptional regulator [Propionibacteriaceae bacterium]